MDSQTKIVFIHQGNSWYLPYALYQAQFASPTSEVILLGDKQKFKDINTVALASLDSETIGQFKQCYLPMSTNPPQFELFCWLRWFYLLNYMKKNQVNSVLYLDSDALLFSSIAEIKTAYQEFNWNCAFSIQKQEPDSFFWTASGHVGYWTRESLDAFCQFSLQSFQEPQYLQRYQQKWQWHKKNNRLGGICDMTTLYLFWEQNSSEIVNLAKSHNDHVFDNNLNTGSNYEDDQYVVENSIKKLNFINNQPYLLRTGSSEHFEQAHVLHCQGRAKQYMQTLYTGQPFSGKLYADMIGNLKSLKSKMG